MARSFPHPRGRRPCACTEVAHTGAGRSRLRSWVMAQDPRCESERSTTAMNRGGKSAGLIVAEKPSNKEDGAPSSAEGVEPSGLTKGNTLHQTKSRTPSREGGDMANSKRARSEKSRTQPRDPAYVAPVGLQQALERKPPPRDKTPERCNLNYTAGGQACGIEGCPGPRLRPGIRPPTPRNPPRRKIFGRRWNFCP